jgi:hypothetical protein
MEVDDDPGNPWIPVEKSPKKSSLLKAATKDNVDETKTSTNKIQYAIADRQTNPTQTIGTKPTGEKDTNDTINIDHDTNDTENDKKKNDETKKPKSILHKPKFTKSTPANDVEDDMLQCYKNKDEADDMDSIGSDAMKTMILRIEAPYTKDGEPIAYMNEVQNQFNEIALSVREDIVIMAMNSDDVMYACYPMKDQGMFETFVEYEKANMSGKRDQTTMFVKIGWASYEENPVKAICTNSRMLRMLKKTQVYVHKHNLPIDTVKSIGLIFLKDPNAINTDIFSSQMNEDMIDFIEDKPDFQRRLHNWDGTTDICEITRRNYIFRKGEGKNAKTVEV